MLVVDASVLAPAVADSGADGEHMRARLRGEVIMAYDGCCAALAEAVDAPLLTADRRLARAPGLRCAVEVI